MVVDQLPFIGETLSLAAAATWALGVIIYKKLGASLSPLALNIYKNAIVFALMVPTVLIVHGPEFPTISTNGWIVALLSGALGIALADTLYFKALNDLGAGRIGIIGNLFSPFVIALAFVFLGERLTLLQGLGFVLVMGGVGLIHMQAHPEGDISPERRRRGLIEGVSAVFLNALGIVMIKPALETDPFFWIATLRLAAALAVMLVLIPFMRSRFRFPAWRAVPWRTLFFAAFLGQYVSMLCWLGGYRYIDASLASIFNESASIFILVFAWWFLGERLSSRKLQGVALSFCGVLLALMG